MNYTRGFIAPLLLAIIALLLVGGGAYVYMQTKQTTQPAVVVSAQATSTVPTAGWKTYTNTKYEFSFKYPSSWFVRENSDKNLVNFSKSELTVNDPDTATKQFASLYVTDHLYIGKEGSAQVGTPEQYFATYYGGESPYIDGTNVTGKWMTIAGMPVFYHYVVGTDLRFPSDNRYEMYTKDKNFSFVLYAGTVRQPTTYEQEDTTLMEQVIGTLSFSDKSVQFINAGIGAPPHIDSVVPSPVSIGFPITIGGSNFDWVPPANCQTNGCIGRSHLTVLITGGSFKSAILAEDESFKSSGQITAIVKSSLCTRSQTNGLPCEPVNITPGQYSLNIIVEGRGTSNSVPITISN